MMLFRYDAWQELFSILGRNRLRTALTSFSVAWGIFILVVLQGAGNGIAKGVAWNFRDDAVNSIWIYGGRTSMPFHGMPRGRNIQLHTSDMDLLARELPGVVHMTARYAVPGGNPLVSFRDKSTSVSLRATNGAHRFIEMTETLRGRFINEADLHQKRKIAVIGAPVIKLLFPQGIDPIGQYIQVKGIAFKIVGVFKDEGGEREANMIYVPMTTAQQVYGGHDEIRQLMFTLRTESLFESKRMAAQATGLLAAKYRFHPEDPRALYVRNMVERFDQVMSVVSGMQFFVLIVGIGTLIAGVVGISNVMLISVRERTRELGIRKALGAGPSSIIGLILHEALFLTLLSGYLGLLAGVGLVEAVQAYMPEANFFRNPEVDFSILVLSTLLLAFAGSLAGFFPALRAARLHPIEALQKQ